MSTSDYGILTVYETGLELRPATRLEHTRSRELGGAGAWPDHDVPPVPVPGYLTADGRQLFRPARHLCVVGGPGEVSREALEEHRQALGWDPWRGYAAGYVEAHRSDAEITGGQS